MKCAQGLAPKLLLFVFSDGWTTNDLIYQWKDNGPVQKTANLSLPGGFKLDGIGDKKCDVITATGSWHFPIWHNPSRWKWVVPCIALIYFSAFLIGCRAFFCRCLQLPTGGDDFRPTAVFLCGDHLRPLLHDRRRVLDVILDRPQSRKSSRYPYHTVNMTYRFNETPWMIQICLKYFVEVFSNNF